MEAQPTEQKKNFLHNDRLLIFGFLALYGVCMMVCILAVFGGLVWRNQTASTNATKTAVAVSTKEAQATATAIVASTQQAQYELIDHFDAYKSHWEVGAVDSDYWVGNQSIKNGVYVWDVYKVKEGFASWVDFDQAEVSKDFDVYVDSKIEIGPAGKVCSGLAFRVSPGGFYEGGYLIKVCNNSYYQITYSTVQGDWEDITDWQYSPAIHPVDWNRLEVKARGSHFEFFVNNQSIFKLEDDRRSFGGIALLIDVFEGPARVVFDNFGYQPR